jgi:hypothetical protein
MTGSFACPECGIKVSLEGHSPGRRIQCENCLTLVEVPFLPRAAPRRRSGRNFDWLAPWVWLVGFVLVVLIVILGTAKVFQWQAREATNRQLNARIDASEEAERSGDMKKALAEMDAALKMAKETAVLRPDRLEQLRGGRNRLSVRAAERWLGDAAADPSDANAEENLLALLKRAARDPALEPMLDRIRGAAVKRAESALAGAQRAVDDQRLGDVMKLANRVMIASSSLPPPDGPRLRDASRALARRIIEERGVEIAPVTGKFRLGSSGSVHADLQGPIAEALRKRGYEPRTSASPFGAMWETGAPYRIQVEMVKETMLPRFFQSAQIGSLLEARVSLVREGKVCWRVDHLLARTRQKPSNIPPREYSMMLDAATPDPKYEQLLYADARAALTNLIVQKILLLPDPKTACSPVPQFGEAPPPRLPAS